MGISSVITWLKGLNNLLTKFEPPSRGNNWGIPIMRTLGGGICI